MMNQFDYFQMCQNNGDENNNNMIFINSNKFDTSYLEVIESDEKTNDTQTKASSRCKKRLKKSDIPNLDFNSFEFHHQQTNSFCLNSKQSTQSLNTKMTKYNSKKKGNSTSAGQHYDGSSFEAIGNNDSFLNEKTRLISINEAFDILRVNIPTFPYERRLSKIDTLHLAISYINMLELVLKSNMTLYDYLKKTISYSFQGSRGYQLPKPSWATSDLTVRLNWLNWHALGISEEEIPNFLNLFKHFGEIKRDMFN